MSGCKTDEEREFYIRLCIKENYSKRQLERQWILWKIYVIKGNIFGSLVVTTKTGIPVKIVFVRNRNKKSECLYLLSTDTSLNNAEIVRIYGNRWSIEWFFKASKSFLKLGSEFQSRSYGAMVSHTTIVFTRYIILEWIRRNQNDQKSYGELFFMYCEDIQDMDLTNALQSLMALFVEHISTLSADITSVLKSKVTEWIASQAGFIQALLGSICCIRILRRLRTAACSGMHWRGRNTGAGMRTIRTWQFTITPRTSHADLWSIWSKTISCISRKWST